MSLEHSPGLAVEAGAPPKVVIPEEPKPHNALTGALSHAEVIARLLYGRKLLPEFKEFEIPWK